MSEDRKITWEKAVFIFTILTAWAGLSGDLKIKVIILFIIIVVAFSIIIKYIPVAKTKLKRNERFIYSLIIAALVPVSRYIISNLPSTEFYIFLKSSYVQSIIDMCLILLIIHISKEWRTIRPARFSNNQHDPFQWGGILIDEVGRGPGMKYPDGAPDALFKLKLQESESIIKNIILRRLESDGEPTNQIWRSEMHEGNWVLGVVVGGQRQELINNELNIPLSETQEIDLFASDNWSRSDWFDCGQRYRVEIQYRNGKAPEFHDLWIT